MKDKNIWVIILLLISIVISIVIYYQHIYNARIWVLFISYALLFLHINACVRILNQTDKEYQDEEDFMDNFLG